jgi:hypothetical protein
MLNITQQDAIWLVEDYNKIRNYGKVVSWMDWHLKTMSLFKGQPVSRPSCSCEFGAYARMANSMYEQNEAELKLIAYPPQIEVIDELPAVKTRGRGRSKKDTQK